jgi:maltose-binding protein MalE
MCFVALKTNRSDEFDRYSGQIDQAYSLYGIKLIVINVEKAPGWISSIENTTEYISTSSRAKIGSSVIVSSGPWYKYQAGSGARTDAFCRSLHVLEDIVGDKNAPLSGRVSLWVELQRLYDSGIFIRLYGFDSQTVEILTKNGIEQVEYK